MRNEEFACEGCGAQVTFHPDGSARNHCPYCLCSKHVDDVFPGDRASNCHGLMRPVGFENRKNKGLVILHECTLCKKQIVNKLAPDDEYLPIMKKVAQKMAGEILE
ncbi:MAG: RNHCP domain-containing protein [Patescibacteria group bacterium]